MTELRVWLCWLAMTWPLVIGASLLFGPWACVMTALAIGPYGRLTQPPPASTTD